MGRTDRQTDGWTDGQTSKTHKVAGYVYLYSPIRQKTEQTNTREQTHKTTQANAIKIWRKSTI